MGKSEKRGKKREKVRRWEKGGKRKTNKDEKRGWHPNMQPSVILSCLNSQTHEVEVLDTLHSQTLGFVLDDKQVASEKQREKDRVVGLVVKEREMENNKPNSVSKASEES